MAKWEADGKAMSSHQQGHEEGDVTADTLYSQSAGEEESVAALRRALYAALDAVDSQEKADAVLAELARIGDDVPVEDAVDLDAEESAATAAADVIVTEAKEQVGEASTADVLDETAQAVAETKDEQREVVSDAVQDVFNPEQQGKQVADQAIKRSYLQRALMKRLGPLDALDTELFLLVNRLPHPAFLNRFFYFLTQIYRGGAAWYALMLALLAWRPPIGRQLWRDIALPLGLAIWLVEYPIKAYFRRRRPFITIVHAVVIGRKPGSWSFPSGHSATAYAGAWLLSRYLPRWRFPLYLIATLTAFSRIYLGAHYPGDVVAGSTVGVLFAWLLRRVPWPWQK